MPPTTTHTPILTRQWSLPTRQELTGKDGRPTLSGVLKLRDNLADLGQKTSDAMTAYNLVGTLAERPAAGQYGRQFFTTDTLTLYEDNGSAWVPLGGAAPFQISVTTLSLTIGPTVGNLIILDTTSGSITVTLPPATGSGYAPILKKPNPMNNLTIQPVGTDTLDGNAFPTGYLVTSIWRKLQLVDYASGKWAIL